MLASLYDNSYLRDLEVQMTRRAQEAMRKRHQSDRQQFAWRVARTEPQQEKRVVSHLCSPRFSHIFEAYLPTFEKKSVHNCGSVRLVERPLFPSYVFVRFDLADDRWVGLLTIPGMRVIHSLIEVNGRYGEVPTTEIDRLRVKETSLRREAMQNGAPVNAFTLGQEVKFLPYPDGGPFAGFSGRIEELDDAGRITILMSLLGRASRVIASQRQFALAHD